MGLKAPVFVQKILHAVGYRRPLPEHANFSAPPQGIDHSGIHALPTQPAPLRPSEIGCQALDDLDDIDLPPPIEEEVTPHMLEKLMSAHYFPGTDERFSGYRVDSRLGRGGMAVIWRVTKEDTGQQRALKVCAVPQMGFTIRESRVMETITKHSLPGVPQCEGFELGPEIEGFSTGFFPLELIHGMGLSEAIQNKLITLPRALEIAYLLHFTLEGPARHGIFHKDINPNNIMLLSEGTLRVLDFGLSNAPQEPGFVRGTVTYMALEQLSSNMPVDQRADIFGIGCTLYEMLSGKKPIDTEKVKHNPEALLAAKKQLLPTIEGVPDDVTQLIRLESAFLPKNRLQTHKQAMEAILKLSDQLAATLKEFENFRERVAQLTGIMIESAKADQPTEIIPSNTAA